MVYEIISIPIGFMYGIFTYIYLIIMMVNVGKYTSPMDLMGYNWVGCHPVYDLNNQLYTLNGS